MFIFYTVVHDNYRYIENKKYYYNCIQILFGERIEIIENLLPKRLKFNWVKAKYSFRINKTTTKYKYNLWIQIPPFQWALVKLILITVYGAMFSKIRFSTVSFFEY